MLKHKGYTGRVMFDDEADLFHGELIGRRDVVTFQGRSTAEVRQAFQESVDDYLEFCDERGELPNAPPTVQVVLPLPDTLAETIHARAAAAHMTDEAWVLRVVEDHLLAEQPSSRLGRQEHRIDKPPHPRPAQPVGLGCMYPTTFKTRY